VEKLVQYLTEGPGDSDDPKRQFKYPYAACEIFACEVDGVFATLLDDMSLMGRLFGFLDTDQPLNAALAGYFGRVIGSLLMRRTGDLMSYIKKNQVRRPRFTYATVYAWFPLACRLGWGETAVLIDFSCFFVAWQHVLKWFMNHLRTTSIAEVIVHLVGSGEQSYTYYGNHHMYWLAETSLMQMLVDRLSAEYPSETQSNAADILAAIAHTQPSPLASKLSSWEFMKMLFQRALDPSGSGVLVPTLNVCIALLDPKRVQTEQDMGMSMGGGSGELRPSSPVDSGLKEHAVSGILEEMPQLVQLLQHDDGEHIPLETAFGKLDARLGSRRWKVVELLAVLSSAGGIAVEEALIQHGAIKTCQTLFLEFPFNNLLHHSVVTLLCACLEGSSTMLKHVIQDCDLPTWLASAPTSVAHSNGAAPMRAGYMGHVTLMGNTVLEIAKQRPEVVALLAGKEQWTLFVSTSLRERNELENVSKWACGRPSSLGNGYDSDPDDKPHDMYNRYINAGDDPDDDDDDIVDSLNDYQKGTEENLDSEEVRMRVASLCSVTQ
jgi:serine/threonine-protein phosphatase 6 regulatory subunit 3